MAEAADVRPEKQTVLEFRQKTRGIRMVAIQNHIRVRQFRHEIRKTPEQ